MNKRTKVFTRNNGTMVLNTEWDNIDLIKSFKDLIPVAKYKGNSLLWGLYNIAKKKLVIPTNYEDIGKLNDVFIPVVNDNYIGLLKNENIIIPCEYNYFNIYAPNYIIAARGNVNPKYIEPELFFGNSQKQSFEERYLYFRMDR